MEEDIDVNEDDSYYPTDVEDDMEYVLRVEDILHGSSGAHVPTSSTTMEDVYFHLSDFDSSFSSDEDMEHMCEEDGGWESNFMNPNLPHLLDEFSKPLFDHISIESSPKFIQFTFASKDLMMLCLQKHKFPTFHEICEVDGNFHPLLTSHGRPIDVNDQCHIEQRWVKLQNNLKLIETIGGSTLSLSSDTKRRKIPHIGIWSSIVSTFHIGPTGKHLSVDATISAIRSKWIMDQRVGGISLSYIESCIKSCLHCQETELWDEVHNIPCELLNDKLMRYAILIL